MASRSFGGVSITDMSRMPSSDMCSVRGMGVALIVSTSTFFRICFRRSLCRTPKRCSSSTTSRPRSRNSTSFDSSRCVPMTMSTLPVANLFDRRPSIPWRSETGSTSSIRTGKG